MSLTERLVTDEFRQIFSENSFSFGFYIVGWVYLKHLVPLELVKSQAISG